MAEPKVVVRSFEKLEHAMAVDHAADEARRYFLIFVEVLRFFSLRFPTLDYLPTDDPLVRRAREVLGDG